MTNIIITILYILFWIFVGYGGIAHYLYSKKSFIYYILNRRGLRGLPLNDAQQRFLCYEGARRDKHKIYKDMGKKWSRLAKKSKI